MDDAGYYGGWGGIIALLFYLSIYLYNKYSDKKMKKYYAYVRYKYLTAREASEKRVKKEQWVTWTCLPRKQRGSAFKYDQSEFYKYTDEIIALHTTPKDIIDAYKKYD